MAVKRLNFMLCDGHLAQQLAYTRLALKRGTVPCQSRRVSVEVWEIVRSRSGIVSGVVQSCEVLGCSGYDADAG